MSDIHFIPAGDQLKDLISQPQCTVPMINKILKERGVFCFSSEKLNTVPNLIMSFLSPEESYELLNSIKTKEKLDKINFRDFLMKDDVNLLHHLSGVVEQENILKKDYLNYQISDFNDFTSLDGKSSDAIVMDFEVCRTDILDDWYITEKFFKGSVEIKKEKNEQVNNLLMNVRLNHTSPETKEIADIILSQIQEHMKKTI
ncbi:hypothetical protein R0H17_21325 [Phytobacter diazotrophicus]|uniref:hypothetical protein n=1 Tax=Phytobacter diazotrophicus TaxID=395631 RepID=UPI002935E669|nr:hypothetical protein [Phytobacter diazotrophicus]MDV2904162.1 hypothetical protein [Phytobacter diazotrophicus]